MKIISWNINGVRSSEGALRDLIDEQKPDILLLQETKCSLVTLKGFVDVHYNSEYAVFSSESYSLNHHGVAIMVKQEIIDRKKDRYDWLIFTKQIDPVIDGNKEGRVAVCIVNGIMIINSYSVNVRRDLSRLKQREEYDNYLMQLMADIKTHHGIDKFIIMGDLNVVAQPIDFHGPVLRKRVPGMTDVERNKFEEIKRKANLVDSFRYLYPDKVEYTFFSFQGRAKEKGKGWRLDYALVSEQLLAVLEDVVVLSEVKTSDHVPLVLHIDI